MKYPPARNRPRALSMLHRCVPVGALALALAFVFEGAAGAQTASGTPLGDLGVGIESATTTLVGTVVTADGAPVPGAVVVTDLGGEAETDARGRFSLAVSYPSVTVGLRVTAIASIQGTNFVATKAHAGLAAAGTTPVGELLLQAAETCEPDWVSTFGGQPGVDDRVYALTYFDDRSGSGPSLFAAGSFDNANGVADTRAIAKWDGHSWSTVGTGLNNLAYALAVYDDNSGSGPALYAGGFFTSAGGVAANRIAKWDGQNWSALGVGVSGLSANVRAFAVYDDNSGSGPALYVGGSFTSAGGVAANRIAKWDGQGWSALGTGVNNLVQALTVYDDQSGSGPALYAGGSFSHAGSLVVNRLAKWDGQSWSALGSGIQWPGGNVFALAAFDDGSGAGPALYAGGTFTNIGGVTTRGIAKWDSQSWSALGSGLSPVNAYVHALVVHDDPGGAGPELYVGGAFKSVGGVQESNLAKWNGSHWSAVGARINSSVLALCSVDDGSGSGSVLYAGGDFTIAGGLAASRIVQWDGATCSVLGSGLNNQIGALTVYDDKSGSGPALIAGGKFTNAAGVWVNRIAKWDGQSWAALGSGVPWRTGEVLALTAHDDGSAAGPVLYAGGTFGNAGGVANTRCIARWDGQSWSALGSGIPGVGSAVHAMTIYDDQRGSGPALFVGGNFTEVGAGPNLRCLAKWDGQSWSALGTGPNNAVRALTVYDDKSGSGPALIAGGVFTTAGGVAARAIAKWDGQAWSPLGSGMFAVTPWVYALAVHDDSSGFGPALYAGGLFNGAGGVSAKNIAKWNGQSWSALGAGLDERVQALTVYDDNSGSGPALYAGGFFDTAGGAAASRIAKWDGQEWSPLGSGLTGLIFALAVHDDSSGTGPALVAGGTFLVSPAGDSYLARWGCASPSPGFEAQQAGGDLHGGAVLHARPAWNGQRIVPRLQLEVPTLPTTAWLVFSSPGGSIAAGPLTWTPASHFPHWHVVEQLPLTSGWVPSPRDRKLLFGRELDVRAIYLDPDTASLASTNLLRLAIER